MFPFRLFLALIRSYIEQPNKKWFSLQTVGIYNYHHAGLKISFIYPIVIIFAGEFLALVSAASLSEFLLHMIVLTTITGSCCLLLCGLFVVVVDMAYQKKSLKVVFTFLSCPCLANLFSLLLVVYASLVMYFIAIWLSHAHWNMNNNVKNVPLWW